VDRKNRRLEKEEGQKRTYIARGGVLLGAEGAFRASTAPGGAVEGAAEAATRPRATCKTKVQHVQINRT